MNKDWTGTLHSIAGCMGATGHSAEERETNDYYATDPSAAEWLLKIEELPLVIWEIACGEGHLSKVFEKAGRYVISTDLIDRGFGEGGVDFLKQTEMRGNAICTNPPYRYATEFVEHALEIAHEGDKICMFLKLTFCEGKGRRKLFQNAPPHKGLGFKQPNTLRKKRSIQRQYGCIRLVCLGEGL